MSPTKQQAKVYDDICYAAFATHFKVVLRSKINPGEEPDDAALRHWNENLPGIQLCWHGLVMGMLTNVAQAQQEGRLPPMVETTTAPLPGLGGGPVRMGNGEVPFPPGQPAALASRLAGEMRARQEAQQARSPLPAPVPGGPYPHLPGGALDVAPGLAIGRETECPPDTATDSGGDCGGDSGSSGD